MMCTKRWEVSETSLVTLYCILIFKRKINEKKRSSMEMYESRCDVENDHWSEEREEQDEVSRSGK